MEISKRLISGDEMPRIGFGTYQLSGEECKKTVSLALKIGYRHIDTASRYKNQREIGEVIKNYKRDELFITSKIFVDELEAEMVAKSINKTLQDLQIDYIDLILIHWPNRKVPIRETIKEIEKFIEKGRVRNMGVSNFNINHLLDAIIETRYPITVNQVEFHPYLNQKLLLEFCKKQNIAITAHTPLARGNVLSEETILKLAKKLGKSPSQIVLRWLLQKDIIAIPKSTEERKIRENFQVFNFELNDEEMSEIDSLNKDIRYCNPSFADFDYKG